MSKSKHNEDNGRRIFIGNLHFDADDDMLYEAFHVLNIKITSARVVMDKETKRSRGFAFVDLAPDESRTVDQAIAAIRGYEFYNRPCRASSAKRRTRTPGQDRRPPHHDEKDHPISSDDDWNTLPVIY